MKNRDEPIEVVRGREGALYTNEMDRDYLRQCKPFGGISKLEYAAIKAMQGILSNSDHMISIAKAAENDDTHTAIEILASSAVADANALFDELEKQDAK